MKVLVMVSIDENIIAQGCVDDIMIPAWSDYARQLSEKTGKDTSLAVVQPQKTFTFAPQGDSDSPPVFKYPKYIENKVDMPKRPVSLILGKPLVAVKGGDGRIVQTTSISPPKQVKDPTLTALEDCQS